MARFGGLGLVLAVLMSPTLGRAAGERCEGEAGSRTLRGHTFLVPALAPNRDTAFVTSHFGIRAGVRRDSTTGLRVGDETLDVTTVGAAQTIDIGIAFSRIVGLDMKLGGNALLGVDAPSWYLRGAGGLFSAELGGVLRVVRNERDGYQLAVRASAGASAGDWAPLFRFKSAVEESPRATFAQLLAGTLLSRLLVPSTRANASIGVHGAYAFNPTLSLQASFGTRFEYRRVGLTDVRTGRSAAVEDTWANLAFGTAFTVDGAPHGVPLALLLEYGVSMDPPVELAATRAQRTVTHGAGVGVYVTGVSHLQLGVSGATLWSVPPMAVTDESGSEYAPSSTLDAAGHFVLRYVW